MNKFRYYRFSVYTYAFASFIEVLFDGTYNKDYIAQILGEIKEHTDKYGEIYDACYKRLEGFTGASVQHQLLKGVGNAGKAVGNFIGSIPLIKDGQVDEWLVKTGSDIEKSGENFGKDTLTKFETNRDPGCSVFTDNLSQVDRLFNQTQEIYIGKDAVYLVKGAEAAQ